MSKLFVSKTIYFEAAHKLREYNGACANLHGHSYKMEVKLVATGGAHLNNGMLLDFKELKEILYHAVIFDWDHAYLNDLEEFKDLNPTAENMVKVAADKIRHRLYLMGTASSTKGIFYRLYSIKLWETVDSYAEWRCE